MKISLALIVKDEAEKLSNLLQSCEGVFDEIVITTTYPSKEVEAVAKEHNAVIAPFKWVNDFSKARNYNFSQCTGDWIMWLDSDDLLQGGENLRKNLELASQNGVTGLLTKYNYSHDKNGAVTDSHWKLQVVRNGYYEWKGVIHEDLMPIKDGTDTRISDVVRVHTATQEDAEASLIRNKEILEDIVMSEPDEPRHYFYLARCYLGTKEWQNVIDVIDTYLTLSNWPEERYDALNMKGEAYMQLDDTVSALKAHQTAILELEDAPDAYIYKARNYIKLEQWLNAIVNLEIAEARDKDRVILKKSALYDHDLYVMASVAYLNVGMFSEAMASAQRAYKNRKTEQAWEMVEITEQMHKDEQLTKQYIAILKARMSDPVALQSVLESVPESIKDDPRILSYVRTLPAKTWGENSVVWFCGDSIDSWDGDSLINGGIGGSETAVVKLSEQMALAGKEVVVYNKCDAPVGGKVINGVRYVNFWEMNHLDHFNTLILWRWPQYVDMFESANKIVLDMHDTSNAMFFTDERVERIDTIMVKSEYHRTLYPDVPDDKFMIVGNGIDLSRFTKQKKNPHRFIYTSCASRGLEHVLDMWPDIRKKLPEAELDIFYGWKNFYENHKLEPSKMEWMQSMQEKMKQDGITNHGRVGQQELADHMVGASIWIYPTKFPEIHCITALEMQASGVYPITTGFAALEETQQSGVKIKGDPTEQKWQERCLNEITTFIEHPALYKGEITKGKDWAQKNSWQSVSDQWLSVV